MFIVHYPDYPDYPDRSGYKLFVDIGSLAASPHFCGAPKKECMRECNVPLTPPRLYENRLSPRENLINLSLRPNYF